MFIVIVAVLRQAKYISCSTYYSNLVNLPMKISKKIIDSFILHFNDIEYSKTKHSL